MNTDADYLNSTVWAKVGVSPIHGVGVIAIRDIPRGTPITDFNIFHHKIERVPFHMSEEELLKIHPDIQELIFSKTIWPMNVREYTFYSPNHEVSLQGFLNHSTDPNTDGHVALREIKKGEELTENYLTVYPAGLHETSLKRFNQARSYSNHMPIFKHPTS